MAVASVLTRWGASSEPKELVNLAFPYQTLSFHHAVIFDMNTLASSVQSLTSVGLSQWG